MPDWRTVPARRTNHKYRRDAHRWTRYEKAQPGHRLQVDVKFLERIAGTRRRFYQSPPSTMAPAFAC